MGGVGNKLSAREVGLRLRQAGQMLRLRGESRYRGAYERGAETIEAFAGDLARAVDEDRLTALPGIGPSLAATIADLVRTGRSASLDRIMGDVPPGVLELTELLPGLTLRRAQRLHDELGIASREDLEQALAAGVLEEMKGIGGAHAVARWREALARERETPGGGERQRRLLVDVLPWAARLTAYLARAVPDAAVEVVGSVRRRVETVGDLNLLAAAESGDVLISALADHSAVLRTLERTEQSCRVRLSGGLNVTLTIAPGPRLPAALLAATGSDAHVARLRARARARGIDLDDVVADSEATLYDRLGLPFIPPELREDAGEIEAADAGDDFHDLVDVGDVRGMVHCHTTFSDGRNTVAEMAAAARAMGMEYLTVTDHSPTASYAGGLPTERLREQWAEIAAARATIDVDLLRGTESDILQDGALDYPAATLASFDVVIASVHERHKLDAASMTRRIVTAMRQPLFKIWGHALGRLLLRRDPIACDVDAILDAVAASPAAIEVNGSPHRLDLPPEWIRAARCRRGIKFVISTDAHSTGELRNLSFGVAMARRGGLRRDDVLNVLPASAFREAVRPARSV